MNPLRIIAKRLETHKDWSILIDNGIKVVIYYYTQSHSNGTHRTWLGSIHQVNSDIDITTCWRRSIIIPLADPELLTKIDQLIIQDFARYKKYWSE